MQFGRANFSNDASITSSLALSRGLATSSTANKQQQNATPAIPTQAMGLGFLGALPFWVFSPAVANSIPMLDAIVRLEDCGMLQVSYGATILSFLGGVHWGLAMTTLTPMPYTSSRYLWSVLPCLAAFPTLIMPIQEAAGVQAALLGFVYMSDRSWAKRGGLPPWYINLRTPLTVLAASGLTMTAFVPHVGTLVPTS